MIQHLKAPNTQYDTLSTAFLTLSGLLAVTYACRGSSSPGIGPPSLRPTCTVTIHRERTFRFTIIMYKYTSANQIYFQGKTNYLKPTSMPTTLTFPSLTEPFPRIIILAPVSFSMAFNVFPRGPIRRPTKFISGCSSCGIMTLSDTFTTGGLENT